MGGFGSGRQFGANCTEDYRAIDSRLWQRKGGLVPGCCMDWTWSRHGESIATIRAKVEVGQVRLQYSYRNYPKTIVILRILFQLQITLKVKFFFSYD